jgi:MutL protein
MEDRGSSLAESRIESILAIDVGAVLTKATLIARIEGVYRFVAHGEAPSTVESPWLDVVAGVDHALEQLAALTGRSFLDDHGRLIAPERPDGAGVDVCVFTVSAAGPLKVVLMGLSADLSMASLQRAAACTYTQVADALTRSGRGPSLEGSVDGRTIKPSRKKTGDLKGMDSKRQTEEDRVRRIYRAQPDVVCIVGGTDGGAEAPVIELVDSAVLAASLLGEGLRPRILFAGNANLRPQVAELVGAEAELKVSDNVRPNVDVESIAPAQAEMETMYQAIKIAQLPGFNEMRRWSTLPVLPTSRAIAHVIEYLSLDTRKSISGVLGVDVGGASTTITVARAGQAHLHVRSDLGTALSVRSVIEARGVEAIIRWLPFEASPGEIEAVVAEKELHPASVPQESHELLIEQAIAREALRAALASARTGWSADLSGPYSALMPYLEPIIGGGSILGRAPRPGQAALMLLDALEPIGVTTLVLDAFGLMPALGACALAQPLATVQALGAGSLITLGTVVTPVGRARVGETVLGLRMKYQNGGDLEVEVTAGSLEVLPLPPGQKARLELRPRRNIDVGRGGPGWGGGSIEVLGGLVGLIIDARGRPLVLPSDAGKRRERVQQWLWDMGA